MISRHFSTDEFVRLKWSHQTIPKKPDAFSKPTPEQNHRLASTPRRSRQTNALNAVNLITSPGVPPSSKTIPERREIVNTKKLCCNCLGAHTLNACLTSKRCHLCNGHHHTLIHESSVLLASTSANGSALNGAESSAAPGVPAVSSHSLAATSHHVAGSVTLLATAIPGAHLAVENICR